MKNLVLVLVLAVSLSSVYAQNSSYEDIMKKNIDLLYKASDMSDYQKVANTFEIVANKETANWLPLYYIALTKIYMSYSAKDSDKKDLYLDEAQKFLDKALALNSNESELIVLQGFLHQARISIAPVSRGQKYSGLANSYFDKAEKINSENPRIYYLKGMNVLNMPKMFGGGKENALPLFQKAKEKFDKFEVSNELYPNWGSQGNEKRLNYCQN